MADFTAQLERTAVFGAPYTWTQKGVNSVLDRFQHEYDGPGEPPVVHYDGNSHLFSMSSDEKAAVNQFSKILSGMIQFSQRHAIDLTAEPLMLQLAGTSLAANIGESNDYGLPMNTLVDVVEDSDNSSDESSLSGMAMAYWKPACKDISILSTDIAEAVSTVTQSYFDPEVDAQRVKIVGGSVQIALQKLQTMEPLMEHMYRHRDGSSSRISQNFVSFTSEQPGKGVEYVTIDKQQHFDRIIVPPALQKDLHKVLIGEERVYTSSQWETPANLVPRPPKLELDENDIPRKPPIKNSRIWENVQVVAIGSAENAKPRASVNSTKMKVSPVPQSKYLDANGQSRIGNWQQNIDPAADPGAAAEQPVEPDLPNDEEEPTTRRIVEDSDSDGEPVARPSMTRKPVTQSDDTKETTVQAAKSPALREGNLFSQASDEIRQRRANRPEQVNPALVDFRKGNSNPVIKANSFYANVPRDPEAIEEITSAQNEKASRQQSFPAALRRPRHTMGFDGANDVDYEHPSRQLAEPSPIMPELYAVPSCFDPGAYGLQNRHDKAQRGGSTASNVSRNQTTPQKLRGKYQADYSQSPVNHLSSVSSNPVPTWPGLVNSENTGSSRQGSDQRRATQNSSSLVQYDEDETKSSQTPLKPPPGLVIRETSAILAGELHLLDSPLDEIQRPSLRPRSDEPVYTSEEASFSTSSSSDPARSLRGNYIPQTKIHRPDLTSMSGDVLRNLMSARNMGQKAKPAISSSQVTERIQEEDEVSSRRFYNTMNLQAPNRGRKSGKQGADSKNTQNSKAQQALRDGFLQAQPQPTVRKPQRDVRPTEVETTQKSPQKPSQTVLDAAKSNPRLAAVHRNAIINEAIRELASNFAQSFAPALEASRSFSGRLEFEMQIGQLMIMPSTQVNPNKVYELLKWQSAFASDRIIVKFTNTLTSQGSDVDGILNGKVNGSQTWSDLPGPARAMLEFTCKDNTGQYFKLLVKEDGSHMVTSDPLVLSKIGIHCPGRMWDACAVLSGLASWQASKIDAKKEIQEFVSTLHMKAGPLAKVYFRTPTNNGFAVLSVHYKRTSLHDCQVSEAQGLQLKITEVKSLTIHSHRDDKKLLVAFEKDSPNQEAGDNDLHYEVAVIDERLNAAFEANQTIGIGDRLENANDFGVSRAQVLLDKTLQLLMKIDWIGQTNYGSLARQQDINTKKAERLGATLPPGSRIGSMMQPYRELDQGLTNRSSISPTTFKASGPRTIIANTTLPGVRAGAPAQLYKDNDGNAFYYGPGGARIPCINSDSAASASEILPGDSASQYGGSRRQASRSVRNDDKPPGFW